LDLGAWSLELELGISIGVVSHKTKKPEARY
jgi:hypothetical protein